MASYGAKMPYFNTIASEGEGVLPTYGDNLVCLGKLVKAALTVTLASGKLYGDDALIESVDEFSSGTNAMETDDMTDDVAAVVYGATVTDGALSYKAGDTSPLGGLAHYKALMRNGVKLYKGYFYPRVKAVLGNDTAQTKGDSITFGTNATSFTVYQCNSGEWRITKEFTDEADAQAWVKAQLAPPEDEDG